MIAVDRSWQSRGARLGPCGRRPGRALSVTGEIGLKLVVLDVIDDGEAFGRRMAFYRRLGFQSFQNRPGRMFIAIDTIRVMFGER